MKPTPKSQPSRLCFECHEAVPHKDSVFTNEGGEHRTFHTDCHVKYRKNLIKKLRQEEREQQGENRQRLATPCLTCGHKRTRVFTGSADGPHVRVCVNGHYQMVSERGKVACTEYAAAVWKSNLMAWQGYPGTSQVQCSVCMESFLRAEGMDHVLNKHAAPEVEEAAEEPVQVIEPEPVQEVAVQEVAVQVAENHTQPTVSDLSLDDLVTELAIRVIARIGDMEQATQASRWALEASTRALEASTQQSQDLKLLVEQMLRGGRH